MKKATVILLCVALFLAGALSVLHFRNQAGSGQQEPYDLGLRFLSEGRYEEAILMFDAAIKIDPNHANAYFHRAEAYLSMAKNCLDPETTLGYLDKAEKDFLKAEILDSSLTADAETLLNELKDCRKEAESALETTAPTVETTAPTEETTTPTEETTEDTVPTTPSTSGNTPSHNPKQEPGSIPTDNPDVDYGEPPAVDIPGTPEHNEQIPPVDSEDVMPDDDPAVDIPGTPEHNEQILPVDPEDVMPDDDPIVDLGSPNTAEPNYSVQITPGGDDNSITIVSPDIYTSDSSVNLGSPNTD